MLTIIHIAVSAALVTIILLQERSSGLSGIMGGGGGSGFYQTRRGFERAIFLGTIVLAIVFVALAVYQLRATL